MTTQAVRQYREQIASETNTVGLNISDAQVGAYIADFAAGTNPQTFSVHMTSNGFMQKRNPTEEMPAYMGTFERPFVPASTVNALLEKDEDLKVEARMNALTGLMNIALDNKLDVSQSVSTVASDHALYLAEIALGAKADPEMSFNDMMTQIEEKVLPQVAALKTDKPTC